MKRIPGAHNACLVIAVLFVVSFVSARAIAASVAVPVRIGFGGFLADGEIAVLIREYRLSPKGLRARYAGFTAGYHIRTELTPEAFVLDARRELTAAAENGIEGSNQRAQGMISLGLSSFLANAQAQSFARDLLRIRSALIEGRSTLQSGSPVFFALDAEVPADQLERLRASPRVAGLVGPDELAGKRPPNGETELPLILQVEYENAQIATANAAELFAMLSEIVSTPARRAIDE